VKEVHVPHLYCFRCGKQGMVYQTQESVQTPRGRLELPWYKCRNCFERWFEYADCLAYVFAVSTGQTQLPTVAETEK